MRIKTPVIIPVIIYIFLGLFASTATFAQSPEISIREFASGQIKKGVRSIGMGGDGATWGNYSLVWKDTSSMLIDAGLSAYTNNNDFSFTAIGVTTPALWHGLAIYAIALSQYASNIGTSLKSPGLGNNAVAVRGDGTNQGIFIKAAMPLSKGFSAGVLLSYERSQFNAITDNSPLNYVKYETGWLPSGGFGISWQPNKRILVGFRALFNQDREKRTDNTGSTEGLNLAHEYRLGVSIGLWKGALIDIGGNLRHRYNQIANTSQTDPNPNIGFEQGMYNQHFALRCGLDETSGTGGFSLRFRPMVFDLAYIHNLAMARINNLYGTNSNSVIATLVFNYGQFSSKK